MPPLPKDLAATAAKVDRRLAKELARRGGRMRQQQLKQQEEERQRQQRDEGMVVDVKLQSNILEGQEQKRFEWPDEIL